MLSTEITNRTTKKVVLRHLWENDPEVAKVRRALFINWIRTTTIFLTLILLVALIYLGSGRDPNWYTDSLDVFVSSFDNGSAGTYFLEAFRDTPEGNQTLNWKFRSPHESSSTLIDDIENGQAWAAVYMNAGTTEYLNQLIQAILNGNASSVSYVPSSATTIIYDQGRNFNTVNGYVLPPIRTAITVASARCAAYLQSQVLRSSNITLSNVIASILLINITRSPIGSTDMDLHPAVPYASILATSLGYLFLWLMMTTLVGIGVRITQPLAGKVKIIDIALFRFLNTVINSLAISLIYSLCVLWFASFTRAVPFIRFWLFNWLAAMTFTVIIGLFIINLGELAQVALTLFLITNLSSSTTNLAIELQNPFYRVGYGLPLFHCFSAGRHFLFGSHTRLNVDIAVLFAYYIAAATLTLCTGLYRMRKQRQEVIEKQRQEVLKKQRQNISNKINNYPYKTKK